MMQRCEHGVYIATGDTTAKNCSWCNPDCMGILGKPKTRHIKPAESGHVLDTAEYFMQPMGARIAEAPYAVEL